ncbi:hypothetical protein BH24CHL7_BH24CHL7_06380 [soil metagenome]
MTLVQQAVGGGTVIPAADVQASIQCREAALDLSETQIGRLACLQPDDLPTPDADSLREVFLRQPRPMTEDAMQPADAVTVHAADVPLSDLPGSNPSARWINWLA